MNHLKIITGTAHAVQHTYMIISRSILLGTRNISGKVVENIEKRFMINDVFPKSVPFFEIIWSVRVKPDRSHMKIRIKRRMRIAR